MCSRTAETLPKSPRRPPPNHNNNNNNNINNKKALPVVFGCTVMNFGVWIFGVYYDTLGSRLRHRGKLLDEGHGLGLQSICTILDDRKSTRGTTPASLKINHTPLERSKTFVCV